MKIIFKLLTGILLSGCSCHPQLKQDLTYPEMISPIYYLETFQIRDPVVIFIQGKPYITTETILRDTLDERPLEERKGVVRYLSRNLASMKSWYYIGIYKLPRIELKKTLYTLQYDYISLFFEDNIIFVDSLYGSAIYHFDIQPQSFLLALVAKTEDVTPFIKGWGDASYFDNDIESNNRYSLENDNIEDIDYSSDYILALAPLFSKKDQKILLQREIIRSKEGR